MKKLVSILILVSLMHYDVASHILDHMTEQVVEVLRQADLIDLTKPQKSKEKLIIIKNEKGISIFLYEEPSLEKPITFFTVMEKWIDLIIRLILA